MSLLLKILSLFYSEEKVFYLKFQELLLESEKIQFQEKYPLNELDRFTGISFNLMDITHLKDRYCLVKNKDDLYLYQNEDCEKKFFPLFKIKNFQLKKVSHFDSFFILEGKKQLKFFFKPKNFIVSSLTYTKNKKNFKLSSFEISKEKCLILDDNCQIIKDTCFECPFGFFEIYTPQCDSKREKICGKTLCGTYNNYACLRGYHHPLKISGCQKNSEEVFCQKNLTAQCINETLICL